MFTIRGNNVFPGSIEAVLRQFSGIAEYRIDVETRRSMQHVKITVEPQKGAEADALVAQVSRAIKDRLHFHAEIIAVSPGELPRFDLKARRFFRAAADHGPK
jgi:phenylacetate-CoA ligase